MDGAEAERLAQQFLEQHGLHYLAANFRTRRGEIDLIMRDRDVLVFVEVRARRPSRFGSAAESITYQKIRRLQAAASAYLQARRLYNKVTCRFDVIAVEAAVGQPPRIDWIKNAFTI